MRVHFSTAESTTKHWTAARYNLSFYRHGVMQLFITYSGNFWIPRTSRRDLRVSNDALNQVCRHAHENADRRNAERRA